jgi:hypothetical protein
MKLGEFNVLKVKREADISYILTDGLTEVFLHKKEADRAYQIDDEIEVFLYDDNKGRITASTKKPFLTMSNIALLEVVNINYDYGVFLYNGLVKDLLLSLDDLPKKRELWPRIKDKLFVAMQEKNNRLFATLISRHKIKESSQESKPLDLSEKYFCYVFSLLDNGIIAFTEERHEIFIHRNNLREKHRVGQKIEVKIISKNDGGNYSGTMILQKELMLSKDADLIYQYLIVNKGQMPYTDKSDSETISLVFRMSKSAFKRALGHLYRNGLVELNDKFTRIKKVENNGKSS